MNEAYVVEVKNRLREEGINQLKQIMNSFRLLFPEHKDKQIYGIIAAVDISEALKKRVLDAGFYVARIKDETFSLDTPKDLKQRLSNVQEVNYLTTLGSGGLEASRRRDGNPSA